MVIGFKYLRRGNHLIFHVLGCVSPFVNLSQRTDDNTTRKEMAVKPELMSRLELAYRFKGLKFLCELRRHSNALFGQRGANLHNAKTLPSNCSIYSTLHMFGLLIMKY